MILLVCLLLVLFSDSPNLIAANQEKIDLAFIYGYLVKKTSNHCVTFFRVYEGTGSRLSVFKDIIARGEKEIVDLDLVQCTCYYCRVAYACSNKRPNITYCFNSKHCLDCLKKRYKKY